ncbi:hypothetical protein L810_5159 [Burkholderia sp. AU4i]|nr:hypothetical protein L810_5159 [Burkholderia sp. AU4i]MDW9230971.1 hypothetical protein [Burkholderia cepacia]MDW9249781.1 hypothetical protein [Burkholderia cepacia]
MCLRDLVRTVPRSGPVGARSRATRHHAAHRGRCAPDMARGTVNRERMQP